MTEIALYSFYSLLTASFSYVYIIILLDADKLLGFIYEPLHAILTKTQVGKWIEKPLLTCVHCNAGQASLWMYLVIYWEYPYNVFWHIGFITLTILIVEILYKTLNKKSR